MNFGLMSNFLFGVCVLTPTYIAFFCFVRTELRPVFLSHAKLINFETYTSRRLSY